jgi:hypothetical protein
VAGPELGFEERPSFAQPSRKSEGGARRSSSGITASWVGDENLETALPNPPRITTGKVVAHKNGFAAA